MSCNFPVTVYQDRNGGPVFFENVGDLDYLQIPCGYCAGCRLARAQAWSVRCQHEASLHVENCFLTLTYDDASLPSWNRPRDTSRWRGTTETGTLHYPDVQKFLRTLRKQVAPKRFSFLCAGEYGERTARPHYHLLLFGHRFERLRDFSGRGTWTGESEDLASLWRYGSHFVGELTVQSAAYVSQYCLKKVYGRQAESFYTVVDPVSGAVVGRRVPEFLRMSLRPAIGRRWYEKFGSDVLPRDVAISENVSYRVPRYYEKLFGAESPMEMEEVAYQRDLKCLAVEPERRAAREEILRARVARNAERRTV